MDTSDRSAGTRPRIQDYRTFASDYDRQRYVGEVNARNEGFRRTAIESLLPAHANTALDVACGAGRGLLILNERSRLVVGVDGTLEMLQQARTKAEIGSRCYCNANGAILPFRDKTFDVVTCLNFLHLFPDRREKLAFTLEIARVLKPGGHAVVEFDSALHGLWLGPMRKYLGKDIGYDWPWTVLSCFPRELFQKLTVIGANIPFVWRIPYLRRFESLARVFPFNYLANRLIVGATRR